MDEAKIPVLIGAGQITHPASNANLISPLELITLAAQKALGDGGLAHQPTRITDIAVTGLTVDERQVKTPFKGAYGNLGHSIGRRLGCGDTRTAYVATGGNTPQFLVNHYAKKIAQGESLTALLAGGEALDSTFRRFSPAYKLLLPWGSWKEKSRAPYEALGISRPGNTEYEGLYKLNLPTNIYPLFENALAHHYGHTIDEHRAHIGELFSRFTEVAANNPFAWFQTKRSAGELITETARNRMIAFPYTKYLNSILKVNQAAALVLTSLAEAKAMRLNSDQWIRVAGFADQNDHWFISERENFYSSPAIRSAGARALKMAGVGIDDIGHFDLYSCFPSAVQIACDELGIAHDDARGLTLTGGLPYFGGPGNNYSMHGIAEMVTSLREHPTDYGLVNANGWYLTKHSIGVYAGSATAPNSIELSLSEPEELPSDKVPKLDTQYEGIGEVETYTILFDRDGVAKSSMIFGLGDDHRRFIAHYKTDETALKLMTTGEGLIGARGQLSRANQVLKFKLH